MGAKYGYVRVSDKEQHPERQIETIRKYCPDMPSENLFIEKISGKRGMDERQEYSVLRRVLREGDELVWSFFVLALLIYKIPIFQ